MNDQKVGKDQLQIQVPKPGDKQKDKYSKSVTSKQSVKSLNEMVLEKIKKTEAGSTGAQSEISQVSRVSQRKGTITTVVTTQRGQINQRINSEHKLPPLQPNQLPGGGYSPAGLLRAKEKFVQEQKQYQQRQREMQQKKDKQQQEKKKVTEQMKQQSSPIKQEQIGEQQQDIQEFKVEDQPLLQSELGQINELDTQQSHSDRSYTISKSPEATPPQSQRNEEYQAQQRVSEQSKTDNSPRPQFSETLPTINEKSETQQFTSPKFESQGSNLEEIQTSKFQVEVESNQIQFESQVIQVEIIKQSVIQQSSQEQFVSIQRNDESQIISNTQHIVSGLIQQYTTKAIGQQQQEVVQHKDDENFTQVKSQITAVNNYEIIEQNQVINQTEGEILQNLQQQLEQNQSYSQTQDTSQILSKQVYYSVQIEGQIEQGQVIEQQGIEDQNFNDDGLGNPFGNQDEDNINQIQLNKNEYFKNKNQDQPDSLQNELDREKIFEDYTTQQDLQQLQQQNADQNQDQVVLGNPLGKRNRKIEKKIIEEERRNQEKQQQTDQQKNDNINEGAIQGQQGQGDSGESQQNIPQQQENSRQQNQQSENEKHDNKNKQKSQIEDDDDLGNPLGDITEEEIRQLQEIKTEVKQLLGINKQEDVQQENQDVQQENDRINQIQIQDFSIPDKQQQSDLQISQDSQKGQQDRQIQLEKVSEQQGQEDLTNKDNVLGNPFGNQAEQIRIQILTNQNEDQLNSPRAEVEENIENLTISQDAQQVSQQNVDQNQDQVVLGNKLGKKNRKIKQESNQDNQQHSDQQGNDDMKEVPIQGQQEQGGQNIPPSQENIRQQNQQSENEKQDDENKQKSPIEDDDDLGNPLGDITEEEIRQLQQIKSEIKQSSDSNKPEDFQLNNKVQQENDEINKNQSEKNLNPDKQQQTVSDLQISQDSQKQEINDQDQNNKAVNDENQRAQQQDDQQKNYDNQDQSQDQQFSEDHTGQQQKQQESNSSQDEQSDNDKQDNLQQKSQISDKEDLGNPLGDKNEEEINQIQKNKYEIEQQLTTQIYSGKKSSDNKDNDQDKESQIKDQQDQQDENQKVDKSQLLGNQLGNPMGNPVRNQQGSPLGNPLGNLDQEEINQIQTIKKEYLTSSNQQEQKTESEQKNQIINKDQLGNPFGDKKQRKNKEPQISQDPNMIKEDNVQKVIQEELGNPQGQMNNSERKQIEENKKNIKNNSKAFGNPLEQSDEDPDENPQQINNQQIDRQQSVHSASRMTESIEFDQSQDPKPIIRSNTGQLYVQTPTNQILTHSVGGNHNQNNQQFDQTSIQRNINSQQQTIIYQNIEIQNEIEIQNDHVDFQQQQPFPQLIQIKEHQLNQLEQEILQFDIQIDQESQLQFLLNVNALDKRELEQLFKNATNQEQKAVLKHLLKLNQEKENEAINFIRSDINFRSEYDDPFKNQILILLENLDDILNTELQDLKQESLVDVVGKITLPQTQKFIERIPQMVEVQMDIYKQNLQKEIEDIEHLDQVNLDDPIIKQVYDKIQQYKQRYQEDQQVIESLKQQKIKYEQQLQHGNNNPPQFQNIQQGQVQFNDLKVDLLFELNKQSLSNNDDLEIFFDKFNYFRVQQYQKSKIEQDYSLNQLIEQYETKNSQLQFIYTELSQLNLINNFAIVNEDNMSKYFIILQQLKDFLISQEKDDDPNADPNASLQEILQRREKRKLEQLQGGDKGILSQIFQQISSAQILTKYQKVGLSNYREFFQSLNAYRLLIQKQYNREKIENSQKYQEQELEQLQDQDRNDQLEQQDNLGDQNQQISIEQCVQEIEDNYQNLKHKYHQLAIEYQQLTLEHQQQQNRIKDVFEDIISDYQENNQQRYIYLRQDYLQNFVDKFHDSMIDFFKNQQTNPQQIQNIQNILLQIRQHQQEVIDIFTVDDEFQTNNEGLKQFIQAFNLKRQQKLSQIDQNIAHYNLDQAFESIFNERKTLQDKINAFKKTIDQNPNQYLPSPKKQSEKRQEFNLEQDDQKLSEQKNLISQLKRQLDAYEKQNTELATQIDEFNKILGENDTDINQIQKVKEEICQIMKIKDNKSLQELLQLVEQEIKQNQKKQIDEIGSMISPRREKVNQQDQDVNDINQNSQKDQNDKEEQRSRQELQDQIKQLQQEIKKLKLQVKLLEDQNKKNQKQEYDTNSLLLNDEDNQIDPRKEKQLDKQIIQRDQQQQETPTALPPEPNHIDIKNDLKQEIKRLNEENNNLRLQQQLIKQESQNMESSMLKIKLQENEKIIEDKNKEVNSIQQEKLQQEQFLAQQRIQIAQLQQELQDSLNQIQKESDVNKKIRDELSQQINLLQEQYNKQVQEQIQNKKDIEEFCANLFEGANSHDNHEFQKNQIIQVFHQSFNKLYLQKLSEANIQQININQLIQQSQRLYETITFICEKLTLINIDEYQEININNIQQYLLSIAQFRSTLNNQISLKQLLTNKDTQNRQQELIIQEQNQQIEDYKNNFEQLHKEKLQNEESLNEKIYELSQQLQRIEQQTNRTISDHNLDSDNDKTLIDKVLQDLIKINYFDLTINNVDQYKEFIDGFLIQRMNVFKQYEIDENLSINQVLKKLQNDSLMKQLRQTRYFNNVDVHNIQEKINEFVKEEQTIANISLKTRDWHYNHLEIVNDIDSLKDSNLKSALTYLTKELDKIKQQPKERQYEQASYQNLIDQIQKMESEMQQITKKEMVQDPLDSAQYLKPGINPRYYIIENLRMGFQMLKDKAQEKLQFYQLDHVVSFERLIEILVDKLLMYREQSQKPKEQLDSNINQQVNEDHLNSLFEIKDLKHFLQYDYKSNKHLLLSNGLERLQGIINQYLSQQEERLLELEFVQKEQEDEENLLIIDRIEEIQSENEIMEPYDRMEKAIERLKIQQQNIFEDYEQMKYDNPIQQFKSQLITEVYQALELNIIRQIEQQQNCQYLSSEQVKQIKEQFQFVLEQKEQIINIMNTNFEKILTINAENIIWNLNDVPENDNQYVFYTAIYTHFRTIYLTILQFHENEINKINVVTLDDYIQNENQLIYAVIKKLQISQDLLKQSIASDYYNLLDNLDPFEENMDQDPLKVKLSEVLKKYRKEYDIKIIGLKEFQLWQQKIQIHDFKNGQYQYQEQDIHKKRYIQIIESLLAQYDQEIIEWIKQLSFSQGEVDQHRDIHKVFMEKFKDYYFARIASQDKVPIIKKKDGVEIETLVPVRYLQTSDYSLKIKQLIELAQLLGQDSVNCFMGLYSSLKKIMKNQQFQNEIEQNSNSFKRIINLFQQKQEEIYEKMKQDQRFEQLLCVVENLLRLNSVSVLKLQLIVDQYIQFVAASSQELYQLNPLTKEGALQMV